MHHLTPDEIDRWLEQALPEVRVAHLESCDRCAWEARETLALTQAMGALPSLAPTHGFADRVLAGLRSPAAGTLPAAWRRWVPTRRRAWALAASFAGLSVLSTGIATAWALANPGLVAAAAGTAQASVSALFHTVRTTIAKQLSLVPWGDVANALTAQPLQLAAFALLAITSYVTLLVTLWNLMRPPRRSYAPQA